MENLLKDLFKTSERRRQITLDNSELKAQISDRIGELSHLLTSSSVEANHQDQSSTKVPTTELEEAIESLKVQLRESERRSELESLHYEELLLEIESSQMRQKYEDNLETALFANKQLSSNNLKSSLDPSDYGSRPGVGFFDRSLASYSSLFKEKISSIYSSNSKTPTWQAPLEGQSASFNDFQTEDDWAISPRVPAPRNISLDKQMAHSVLVSWKPPEFSTNNQEEVTAYHIYADGQFRTSVGDHEKRRALVDNIDASKKHRISIRTVTGRGQSKDAECTLLVGRGASAAPTRLKASNITTNSAKLSWLPGSSNFYHAVFLNDHELSVCRPGVYKLFLTGLPPDTLQRVCVEARRTNGLNDATAKAPSSNPPNALPVSDCLRKQTSTNINDDNRKTMVYLEFRTAPIGLPDPPKNVQVEAGPQDGVLLISWRPVPQATHVVANFENEPFVHGYTVCINNFVVMKVKGNESDHALLPLRQLAELLKSEDFIKSQTPLNPKQSTIDRDHQITVESSSASSSSSSEDIPSDANRLLTLNKFNQTVNDGPLHLQLTVHSSIPKEEAVVAIVSGEETSAWNGFVRKNNNRDSHGLASPPIHLMPNLLLIVAGSLETAVSIFGRKLSKQLGIDETSAAVACVSIRQSKPVSISIEKPGMDAERSDNHDSSDEDPPMLHVHAGHIPSFQKTKSSTSDALDSAEALLRERQLQKHSFSDSSKQTRRNSLRDNWILPEKQSSVTRSQQQIIHHSFFSHPKSSFERYATRFNNDMLLGRSTPRPHSNNIHDINNRRRSGRNLRPTRSMSDENEDLKRAYLCHLSNRGNRKFSTESTESELISRGRAMNAVHLRPFSQAAQSSLDIRAVDRIVEEDFDYLSSSSSRRHLCRLHRNKAQVSESQRNNIIRRSKSLGREPPFIQTNVFSSCISSSSNDEGISRAYFQRLEKQHGGVGSQVVKSSPLHYKLGRSKSFGQSKYAFDPYEHYVTEIEEKPMAIENLKIKKFPTARCNTSRHWLQKITSVPEICIAKLNYGHRDYQPSGRFRARQGFRETLNPKMMSRFQNASQFSDLRSSINGRILDMDQQWSPEYENAQLRHLPRNSSNYADITTNRLIDNRYGWPLQNRSQRDSDKFAPRYPEAVRRVNQRNVTDTDAEYDQLKSGKMRSGKTTISANEKMVRRGPRAERQINNIPRTEEPKETISKSSRKNTGSDNCKYFVAIYDYDPATMSPNPGAVDDELPFIEGQVIRVFGDCDEDGFYYGECNNRRGFVPSNMVSEVNSEDFMETSRLDRKTRSAPKKQCGGGMDTRLPPGQVTNYRQSINDGVGGGGVGGDDSSRKVQQYENQQQTEEILPQTRVRQSNRNGRGCSSSFRQDPHQQDEDFYNPPNPISHIDDKKQQEQKSITSRPQIQNRKRIQRKRVMTALYDYDPHIFSPNVDVETELHFRAGDRFFVFGEMDEDGFYMGQLESGQRGLVPSNFLREENETEQRVWNYEDNEAFPGNHDEFDQHLVSPGGLNGSYNPRRRTSMNVGRGSGRDHSGGSGRLREFSDEEGRQGSIRRSLKSTGSYQNPSAFPSQHVPMRKRLAMLTLPQSVGDDTKSEDESMIASTVPPANDWRPEPEINVSTSSPLLVSRRMSNLLVDNRQPLLLPQQSKRGDPVQQQAPFHNVVSEPTEQKDSFDSDGQGVIVMDFNSSGKSRKNRKISRTSSTEQGDQLNTISGRRSVFRSPFKKDSSHR